MMTDTTVTRKLIGTAAPRHFNKPIAEAVQANIDRVGLPTWTEDEQTLRQGGAAAWSTASRTDCHRGAQARAAVAAAGERRLRRHRRRVLGGADRARSIYPSNIPNLPGHNWSNAIAMATPIAHKGIVAGGKVMAMTMVDLLMRPEVVVAAKSYFTDVQHKNGKFVAVARRQRPAAGPAQSRDDGALPPADAQVLLRRQQVRHLSRPARRQVPDLREGAVTIWTHARPSPRMTNWNFEARATAPA